MRIEGTRLEVRLDHRSFVQNWYPDTELELAALTAEAVFLDRVTVIEPHRSDWQVQTHSNTNILVESPREFSRGCSDTFYRPNLQDPGFT